VTDPDRTAQIFQKALEVAPERRLAFLDAVCASDSRLRGEVVSLLEHHHTGTLAGVLDGKIEPSPSRSWTPAPVRAVAATLAEIFRGRRRRTIAWILAAVFLAGVGSWTRDRVQRSLRTQIQEELRVVLVADTTALETWIATRTAEARFWADNPSVRELAVRFVGAVGEDPAKAVKLKDSPWQKEFAAALHPFLAQAGAPDDIGAVLIDRSGLRLAATYPFESVVGNRSNERAAAALVAVLDGKAKFMPPSRLDSWAEDRPSDPRAAIITAAPVRNSNGTIIAVLALAKVVEPAYSSILTVARMGKTGETYAISPDGRMLSPSRFEDMLKKAGMLPDRPDATSVLSIQVRDPGGDVTRGYQPTQELDLRPLTTIAGVAIASRGKPADQQTGVIMQPYRDYRGIEVLGAWRWLPEYDFGVVTEVDADEAFAVLAYVGRAFTVLFSLLTVFVVLTVATSVTLARMGGRSTKLGAYTLLRLLGEGGMSKVYLARHALLRRPTAVKVLKDANATSHEAILRFEREVQAASGLTHPNTIQIYDFGQTPEGTFYYAMEYLAGLNLTEIVTLEGPIKPGRTVQILKQICGSLREAHEHGILHRDIKPLNIMLCERGGQCDFVKVLDFGLVRHLNEATLEISSADRLIGTPLYMAPERFANPTAADPRSDIYSVGAVAYFLLTGRPVFQALTGLDLQNQVMHTEPELPSKRVPHPVPSGLEQLVLQCLSKDQANRPASMAALLSALETLPDVDDWTREQARDWWTSNVPGLLKPSN
jgi:hypothetical protein